MTAKDDPKQALPRSHDPQNPLLPEDQGTLPLPESRQLGADHADWLYVTATDLAGFVSVIDENPVKLPPDDVAKRDAFIDQAIAWLTEAINHGFADTARIESEAALNDIRDQPAFVDLLETGCPRATFGVRRPLGYNVLVE